jgi:hypothetical protein
MTDNHHHHIDCEEKEDPQEEEHHIHVDCEEEYHEEHFDCEDEENEEEHPHPTTFINDKLVHVNYKTIDLATISTYTSNNTNNISVLNCKLVPIHIKFDAFCILFFKQKSNRYSVLDSRFINILFNKVKIPLLQKITQEYTGLSCKNNILLHKEIFAISLENRIKNLTCLDYDEFKMTIQFYNTPYVRIMTTVFVKTINTLVTIEFVFNVKNRPRNLCDQLDQFIFEN